MGTSNKKLHGKYIEERVRLFFGDSQALVDAALNRSVLDTHTNGTMIISQEDTDDYVYYLLDGKANAVLYTEDGDKTWLDSFNTGNLFGEMAALTGSPRTASIIAKGTVTVLQFRGEDFLQLMRDFGQLGIEISKTMAKRVEHTTRRMYELSTLSSHGRVYAELIRLGKYDPDQNITFIERLPTKTRLAERVNASRETVSRAVSKLSDLGYVEEIGRSMIIRGKERLTL